MVGGMRGVGGRHLRARKLSSRPRLSWSGTRMRRRGGCEWSRQRKLRPRPPRNRPLHRDQGGPPVTEVVLGQGVWIN